MREDVLALLACPHCGGALGDEDGLLRCPRGHAFDRARQGYVTLMPGGSAPRGGDSADMVAARAQLLEAGHLAPLTDALAEAGAGALADGPAGGVVEVGAGPGHHLAAVLDRAPGRAGLALDVSRAAARRAARAHPRAGAVVCDAWRALPVRTGAAALALDVFAPRNGAELRRILHPGGTLLVASPTPRHLRELVGPLGLLEVDPDKARRIEGALGPGFARDGAETVEFTMSLGRADAARLVAMGPSARHVPPDVAERRLAGLGEPLAVTASVELARYRPA